MNLDDAIQIMTDEIVAILGDNKPSVYLYGSVVLDDFRLGWSDIDILVLTKRKICAGPAEALVGLRQALSERYPNNPYFRLFEGGMRSVRAFLANRPERTVYWGTSGQRITDSYKMDSFGMAELLDSGILLYGDDIRERMTYPTYAKMRDDIARHVQAARKYGDSVGWLLDIARGIYTLRTAEIIAKTAAGEWALENNLCPDADAMQKAIRCRKEAHLIQEKSIDNSIIQRFADVLDAEFANTAKRFAQSELQRMNIAYDTHSLIRNKDGVSVWRVSTDNGSVVMKCFEKIEYRREITNYLLLKSLGIPTLELVAHTDCSLIMEDIERSEYRLGTPEDIRNPDVVKHIAKWYKTLHKNGRKYAQLNTMYGECDMLTAENIATIKRQTKTEDSPVWEAVEDNFDALLYAITELSRTITYNDFHFTNLAVSRNDSSAIVFDYNMLGKGYVYSDIRNVCGHLGNEEARKVFLAEYGSFEDKEKLVDDVVCPLFALHIACQRESFPDWANDLLEKLKDGTLLSAVKKLLEEIA